MVFALCGGDERIARLASMLVEDGHGVRAWALEDAPLAEEEAVIPDSAPIPPARRSAQEDAPHSVQSATAQLLATLNAMLGQD